MPAHENHLRQLLDSTQQYIVPLFQRFYIFNLAATSIQRFYQWAVETMGLPPEGWIVKMKPSAVDAS